MISVVHPTVRPKQALEIKKLWLDAAEDKNIEYLFAIDDNKDVKEVLKDSPYCFDPENPNRMGCVSAVNYGLKQAQGAVLVVLTDDVFPCPSWDKLILESIGDTSQEVFLACKYSEKPTRPDIIHNIIITRPYFERRGWILHPDFFHVYADDFLTAMVLADGVLKFAPHIFLEHRHPFDGKGQMDEYYQKNNSQAQYMYGEYKMNALLKEYGLTRNAKPLFAL